MGIYFMDFISTKGCSAVFAFVSWILFLRRKEHFIISSKEHLISSKGCFAFINFIKGTLRFFIWMKGTLNQRDASL